LADPDLTGTVLYSSSVYITLNFTLKKCSKSSRQLMLERLTNNERYRLSNQ
jgi:hypothetical protein